MQGLVGLTGLAGVGMMFSAEKAGAESITTVSWPYSSNMVVICTTWRAGRSLRPLKRKWTL
jgi:hypothetical protein